MVQAAASLTETAWASRWKMPEVEEQQDQDEGREAGVEPPVLGEREERDAVQHRAPSGTGTSTSAKRIAPRSSSVWRRKRSSSGLREVATEVAAAALLAEESALGHGARHGHEVAVLGRGAVARAPLRDAPLGLEVGQQLLDPLGVAFHAETFPGPLPQLRARRVGLGRHGAAALGIGHAARELRARLRSSPRRRAAPKTSPSSSELLASRLAPWTPVPATSPAAYRPGIVRPPLQVGRDAAHHVVRGRSHGDEVPRDVDAETQAGRVDPGEAACARGSGSRCRRSRLTGPRPACASRKMARATWSRGASSSVKRSPAALRR